MKYKNKNTMPGGRRGRSSSPPCPEGRNRPSPEKIDAGAVWLEALLDFENELHEHVEQAKKDQLRFGDGRLFRSLKRHIKANTTGKDEWYALFYCYRFMTDKLPHPGYDEARRLHDEEMEARGLLSAREFCSSLVESLDELLLRVRSIASWMEALESFSLWLVFKDLRPGWRGDRNARARTIQAAYLSKQPQRCLVKTTRRGRELLSARFPEGLRVGTNYDNTPWNDGQWQNILKQSARLTEKRYDCTELERWLWWCHSVFRRFRWNTREVREAAIRRGFPEVSDMYEANFRRRLISMGLRLSGQKQTRRARAPLAEFVEDLVLPEPGEMLGSAAGFLTKKNDKA
jgi:hypothetical protein